MPADPIVSIAFLTRQEVDRLAGSLAHCYPVSDEHAFDHLLAQLDEIQIELLGQGIVIRPPSTTD